GASGGVGSAAVQLAKRRGAEVLAVSGASKHAALARIGADRLLDRDADLVEALGTDSVDVVLDMVAGPAFGALLEVLARGGRYACSGAIAGPIVRFDTRKMYLKDLQLFGCVGWDAPVFPNLIGYIERGEIRPVLDRSWPLDQIADAQRAFQQKNHVGKMVLLPPV
ncbi:MAG: zinc-binding dehydrogenase, partial [Pseudomonadota bacterium]